jgi:hypothetical protein
VLDRIVAASRQAQGLPETVTDLEVLARVAELLEGGAIHEKAS